ncbi:hypothetical protein VHEMI06861 [[Torrubiella] hemipterigena]|uniref:Uncharacterized protein n=1 Tax=[Torrubiella] hemipterigena TaxID=1531966 RepID=A0A0A1T1S8_9HYPO|nr:hypothetical protein VHEMI06861 [[Torrubiella] hemipterigena]
MASDSQYVLYDIPTKDPVRCWSWNVWKSRFVLNFKGLDYVTEWTEYPEIRTKLQEYFPGKEEFTVPTVRLPNGEYIMDSMAIAARIEKDHPEPSLHLDYPHLDRYISNLKEALIPLQPIYIHAVAHRLLTEKSLPFFLETRAEDLGMSLDEFHEQGKANAWKDSVSGLTKMKDMLLEEKDGPFFMGATVSYVDFLWAGVLLFYKALGDDIYAEFLKASGDGGKTFTELLEAVKPWSGRASG